MCLGCTIEEVTGVEKYDGPWGEIPFPEVTSEMKMLARLRWVLYECTSAITGGPMHIFTDDYNADDSHIEVCEKSLDDHWGRDEPDWYLVRAVSQRIVALARPMSVAERVTALSLSWGEIHIDGEGKILPGRYLVGETTEIPGGWAWAGRFVGQMPYLPV